MAGTSGVGARVAAFLGRQVESGARELELVWLNQPSFGGLAVLMNMEKITQQKAEELFVTAITNRAYSAIIESAVAALRNPIFQPSAGLYLEAERKKEIHSWFQNLTDEERTNVESLIKASIKNALFGCFNVLDGTTGGWPLKEVRSEYVLSLRVYEVIEDIQIKEVDLIKISPDGQDELHDLFMSITSDTD